MSKNRTGSSKALVIITCLLMFALLASLVVVLRSKKKENIDNKKDVETTTVSPEVFSDSNDSVSTEDTAIKYSLPRNTEETTALPDYIAIDTNDDLGAIMPVYG